MTLSNLIRSIFRGRANNVISLIFTDYLLCMVGYRPKQIHIPMNNYQTKENLGIFQKKHVYSQELIYGEFQKIFCAAATRTLKPNIVFLVTYPPSKVNLECFDTWTTKTRDLILHSP